MGTLENFRNNSLMHKEKNYPGRKRMQIGATMFSLGIIILLGGFHSEVVFLIPIGIVLFIFGIAIIPTNFIKLKK